MAGTESVERCASIMKSFVLQLVLLIQRCFRDHFRYCMFFDSGTPENSSPMYAGGFSEIIRVIYSLQIGGKYRRDFRPKFSA